ncbi:hypothetical protein [Burkholderia pseudomallei]|uniref:hypothetical protein n=1 Tax=Burkholderia pseudomallei TaxID=28450 RepID=UPI000F058A9F|nr:hypothetical protein [Burkholderia pseudomallei]VBG63382.1 Uncharacterised protein [Burkholderia pseudomallei]
MATSKKADQKTEDEKKVGLGARADAEWKTVRGIAWSRAVRATVEKVLNRSDDLTPRMREPWFREHLLGAMSRVAGDDRFERPEKAWKISGREMDRLAESQLDDEGSSTSNTWTRWEKGRDRPEGRRWKGALTLFPGSVPKSENVGDAMKVVERDVGFAELFWSTGPCWDDLASPVPLWAMMDGDSSIEGFWVPVLRYHDGTGLDGHAVADFLHGGVAFVRSTEREAGAAEAQSRASTSSDTDTAPAALEGKARIAATRKSLKLFLNRPPRLGGAGGGRTSLFPKPGVTPAPKAAPSPYDGPARSAHLLAGVRPLLNPDLSPGEQSTFMTGNTTYQAQRLATLDADWFHRLIVDGTAAQDDASSALGVGDVMVLVLATIFTAGERGDLRHSLEDLVFREVRARHRRFVRWAQPFGIEAGVRRWLRRLYAEYLDRNRLAFLPVETPAQPDEELVYDRDDPEAEYIAHEDNVPTVTAERARAGRLSGDQRLSRRRKA